MTNILTSLLSLYMAAALHHNRNDVWQCPSKATDMPMAILYIYPDVIYAITFRTCFIENATGERKFHISLHIFHLISNIQFYVASHWLIFTHHLFKQHLFFFSWCTYHCEAQCYTRPSLSQYYFYHLNAIIIPENFPETWCQNPLDVSRPFG